MGLHYLLWLLAALPGAKVQASFGEGQPRVSPRFGAGAGLIGV